MSHITKACCVNPPVLSEEYKPVGEHTAVKGLQTYAAGPKDAKKGLIFFYDAIGASHQCYTAVDMLASLLPDTVVLMPDFFHGKPIPMSAFSLPEDERMKVIKEWASTVGDIPKALEAAKGLIDQAKDAGYSSIQQWGAFGLCWGGKATALVSAEATPFVATGAAHPGRVDTADAKAITIPYVCLFSYEDGTLGIRQEYETILKDKANGSYIETYEDRVHGWMGARCDFKDEKARAEFERGYKKVAEFFNENFSK